MLLADLLLCPLCHSPMAAECHVLPQQHGSPSPDKPSCPGGPDVGPCPPSCRSWDEAVLPSSAPCPSVQCSPAQLSSLELCVPALGKGSTALPCALRICSAPLFLLQQLHCALHLSPTWAQVMLAQSIHNTSTPEASFCLWMHSATCSASGATSIFLCLYDSLIHFTYSTWWMFSPFG